MITTKFKIKCFLFFVATIILVSCNDSAVDTEKSLATPENLSRDKNFINMAIEMNNSFLFINKAVESSKLSTDEIASKIGLINGSNVTEEVKVEQLSLLLDRDITSRIKANSTIIDANMKMLNAKYQNINKETLQKAFILSLPKINSSTAKLQDTCSDSYYLCVSAAFGATVVCHLSCESAAVATTAGLGIPVCIAACGIVQVYMGTECYRTHCSGKKVLEIVE